MKQTPEEFACKIWGTDVGADHSDFTIPLSTAIEMIQTYVDREVENLPISSVKKFPKNPTCGACGDMKHVWILGTREWVPCINCNSKNMI